MLSPKSNSIAVKITASLTLIATLLGGAFVGCETDSFIDPSVVGSWETGPPMVLPILNHLDVIDESPDILPGLSQIRSEDLIPQYSEYVVGPGDTVTVAIFELVETNVETVQTRIVNELGTIRLPVIGEVPVAGLSARQIEGKIVDILDPDILRDPTVTVVIDQARNRTFTIVGAVRDEGTFILPRTDFRLIDALALARGIDGPLDKVHVIRQVSLSPDMQSTLTAMNNDEDLVSLDPLDDVPAPLDAAIDGDALDTRWVVIDDKWVQVQSRRSVTSNSPDDLPPPSELMTQRIIEVDARGLMNGIAQYNIVIRPGDIIRVPDVETGLVFLGGPGIARGGSYELPVNQQLTMKQLIISAGGLSAVGVPERVDLVRRLGPNTEATVRLNLREIFEGHQPDFFIKPNDMVNIGTNLPATLLAVVRNSFRVTYGFGFLLDRNFGNDVFGAPPASRFDGQ